MRCRAICCLGPRNGKRCHEPATRALPGSTTPQLCYTHHAAYHNPERDEPLDLEPITARELLEDLPELAQAQA